MNKKTLNREAANYIRMARSRYGMSQAEFARLIGNGLGRESISNYERIKCNIPAWVILKVDKLIREIEKQHECVQKSA